MSRAPGRNSNLGRPYIIREASASTPCVCQSRNEIARELARDFYFMYNIGRYARAVGSRPGDGTAGAVEGAAARGVGSNESGNPEDCLIASSAIVVWRGERVIV